MIPFSWFVLSASFGHSPLAFFFCSPFAPQTPPSPLPPPPGPGWGPRARPQRPAPAPGARTSPAPFDFRGADVVNAMGSAASQVFESTGLASFQDSSTDSVSSVSAVARVFRMCATSSTFGLRATLFDPALVRRLLASGWEISSARCRPSSLHLGAHETRHGWMHITRGDPQK